MFWLCRCKHIVAKTTVYDHVIMVEGGKDARSVIHHVEEVFPNFVVMGIERLDAIEVTVLKM